MACLPFATGTGIRDYELTTRWMCYGLKHGVPLVNGYSGFCPEPHLELQELIADGFPSSRVLREFLRFDVEYVVVARSYCKPEVMLALGTEAVPLELVLADPMGIDVYRLGPPLRMTAP